MAPSHGRPLWTRGQLMVYQVYLVSSIKRRPCERNKRLDECKIGRMGHAPLICSSILNKGWTSILAPSMNQTRP